MAGKTMFEKIWDDHVVAQMHEGVYLLHIDRHIIMESACAPAFAGLSERGLKVRNPELTFATIDHIVSTMPGRTGETFAGGTELVRLIRQNTAENGVRLFDIDDPRQGIVHVVAPEQGIALPGTTVVCADSHTPSSGGLGALAWGIGTSETEHVFATQMLLQRKPKQMRVLFEGALAPGVTAKDMVLYLIGQIGVSAGRGYAVEYGGSAVRSLSIEGRVTICNMSIEFGAKFGFVAPDSLTYDYLRCKPYAPKGADWERAIEQWRRLPSDDGAIFDQQVTIDCGEISPQVSWGSTPEEVIGIDQHIPDLSSAEDSERRKAWENSLAYQGLLPGQQMEGVPIDVAFIGSCTNGRLSDLKDAARVVRGRRVAAGVRALVVPGSSQVKREAETAGLDKIFLDAGFEWREAGCSMCISINDDIVAPGARCIATSNRNFQNRQGPGSRTHIASPAMVAAAAVSGKITDVRAYLN